MILLPAVSSALSEPSAQVSVEPKPERKGVPQPHGGMLIPGKGGGNNGGGRPPDAFRALMRQLATQAAEVAAAHVIPNDRHPAWLGASKWASEHGYGRPVETREYSGTVTVRVVRDTQPTIEAELIEGSDSE